MPRPHVPRSPVHVDPQKSFPGDWLQRCRVPGDHLIPPAGTQRRIVTRHARNEPRPPDHGGESAGCALPAPALHTAGMPEWRSGRMLIGHLEWCLLKTTAGLGMRTDKGAAPNPMSPDERRPSPLSLQELSGLFTPAPALLVHRLIHRTDIVTSHERGEEGGSRRSAATPIPHPLRRTGSRQAARSTPVTGSAGSARPRLWNVA